MRTLRPPKDAALGGVSPSSHLAHRNENNQLKQLAIDWQAACILR
jgi:hypothetical protein